MSLTIEYVKDKEGNRFYPVTQEKGVFDENGVCLDTKLNQKESTSNKVTSISSESNHTQYPSAKAVYDAITGASGGYYIKPQDGIPKTDLASAVQTSLGKADTALQSYTETDPVFLASAAYGITSTDISNWNGTVSNVQSDWNASTGLAEILNKPDLSVYPKYVLCADVAAYTAITTKDSGTLYCIPETPADA